MILLTCFRGPILSSGKPSHVQVSTSSQKPANTIAAKPQKSKVALPDRTAPLPPTISPPSQTRKVQDKSVSSSSTSKPCPGSPVWGIDASRSSMSSVDAHAILRRSREVENLIPLVRCVESAKYKLDLPVWREHGQLGDDFACITEELLDEFIPPKWYSVQLILAWRASIIIPDNWTIMVPDEIGKKGLMSKHTTDIIQVNHDAERLHFTMTHLSVERWRMVYYDSQLSQYDSSDNDRQMWKVCDELVKRLRLEGPGYGIAIKETDPVMSARVSHIHVH